MSTAAAGGGDAAARGAWVRGRALRWLAGAMAVLVAARTALLFAALPVDTIDFQVFHAAARLTLAGDWPVLFDNAAFAAEHGLSERLRWLYPAHGLLLIAPLGLMALPTAFVVQGLAGWALYGLAGSWLLRRVAPGAPVALHVLLAFAPAVFWPMMVGHPSLFWFAGLMAALALREGGRSLGAGLLVGLLTIKPSLGVLVGVALIAARDGRAVGGAVMGAALAAGLATLALGVEYWPAYAAKLAEHGGDFAAGPTPGRDGRLLGMQGLVLSFGGTGQVAAIAHWTVAALATAAVALAWWRRETPACLRLALLFALIPLVAPSVWFYDAVTLSLAAVFLVAGGAVAAAPLALAIAALLYANVLPAFLLGLPAALASLPAALGALWLATRGHAALSRTPASTEDVP